jgi:hypothetical protein
LEIPMNSSWFIDLKSLFVEDFRLQIVALCSPGAVHIDVCMPSFG